jgi:hypothetical protein
LAGREPVRIAGMTERNTDKHGPRLDDAIGHEVEAMVRGTGPTHSGEWRDAEVADADEPAVGAASGREGGTPDGMDQTDLDRRAELAAALGRTVFPADAGKLRARLADENAPDHLLGLLKRLPGDQSYQNIGEVWAALRLPAEDLRF